MPIVMDDPADLRGAFAELRQRGVERISCIGGRTLAAPLLDAGLVQDLYLTTGTKEGGEPGTPVSDKPLNGREIVRKNGTGPDAGVVFEHVALS
jgi:riboflavin biosynthesis pyrimidine reductase